MTITEPSEPSEPEPKADHSVALWAGVAAFFASLLAIGIFDVLDPDKLWEYLGSLIVAGVTAGGVYAKQRLDDARLDRERRGLAQQASVEKPA